MILPARYRRSPDDLTAAQWGAIVRDQGNRCRRCGRTFNATNRPTKDHLIPESKGGRLTFRNVAAICKPCNSAKGARWEPWVIDAIEEALGRRLPEERPGHAYEPITETSKTMNVNQAFPSKWLKASDAEDGPMILTIASAAMEEVNTDANTTENKLVVRFQETEKGLICNKTNANTIAAHFGSDTDDWEGKRITLVSVEVQFQSKMVPAIRVSTKLPKAPKAEKPAAAAQVAVATDRGSDNDPADDEDIPF